MKVDNQYIFEQIGSLFYAVAADQHVKPLEVGELKSLISKDWPQHTLHGNDSASIVSDETHWIIIAMDTLEGNRTSAKEAFNEFAKFYKLHSGVLTEEVKNRVLETAIKITKIFKADNPSDNAQLRALKELLESAKVEKA